MCDDGWREGRGREGESVTRDEGWWVGGGGGEGWDIADYVYFIHCINRSINIFGFGSSGLKRYPSL